MLSGVPNRLAPRACRYSRFVAALLHEPGLRVQFRRLIGGLGARRPRHCTAHACGPTMNRRNRARLRSRARIPRLIAGTRPAPALDRGRRGPCPRRTSAARRNQQPALVRRCHGRRAVVQAEFRVQVEQVRALRHRSRSVDGWRHFRALPGDGSRVSGLSRRPARVSTIHRRRGGVWSITVRGACVPPDDASPELCPTQARCADRAIDRRGRAAEPI